MPDFLLLKKQKTKPLSLDLRLEVCASITFWLCDFKSTAKTNCIFIDHNGPKCKFW